MTRVTILNQDREFPTEWSEVTLIQFIRVMRVIDGGAHEYDNPALYAAILGISVLDFYKIKIKEFMRLSAKAGYLSKPPDFNFYSSFEFGGVKYQCAKSLTEMQLAQFQDFDNLATHCRKKRENLWIALPQIFAILYTPQGADYSVETKSDVEARAKLFESAPVTLMYGAFNFFFMVEKTLSDNFQTFLGEMTTMSEKASTSPLSTHPIIGAGTTLFSRFASAIKSALTIRSKVA
jgi:hypothetical protein